MGIPLYLAQTSAEFASSALKPQWLAWMACHFSPYSTGITNLPKHLPRDSLLILNDRTPPQGHDPKTVCQALSETVQRFSCRGILLDFQHHGCDEVVSEAVKLPCPVAVTERYAAAFDCPVFLSSPPLSKPLKEYIKTLSGREIWLEAGLGYEEITVTEKGSIFSQLLPQENEEYPFYEEQLHCRYRTEIEKDRIRFTLRRGKEELTDLLEEAGQLGIKCAIGLYQELGR